MVTFSVVPVPSHKIHWTTYQIIWHRAFVVEAMTRPRFEKILKYDTTANLPRGQPGHNKLRLIRLVMEQVLHKCVENNQPSKEYSGDEAMITYKGRLSFKQQALLCTVQCFSKKSLNYWRTMHFVLVIKHIPILQKQNPAHNTTTNSANSHTEAIVLI